MSKSKLLPLFLSVGFLAVVLVIISIEPEAVESTDVVEELPLNVSVLEVNPQALAVKVSTTGVTKSRWLTDISAQVDGVVEQLNPKLEPGNLLTKNTLLLKLNPVHLETQLAQAQSAVSRAELALTKEQHERTVAQQMLSQSDNEYARHEPQVAAAKADLISANKQLLSAQKRLKDSKVRVPFDGVVISTNVAPGKYIQAGVSLLTLASSESMDVQAWLSQKLWSQLEGELDGLSISIGDRAGNTWPASVRYIAPSLDPQTKQRQLVLKVDNPYGGEKPLRAEQFVTVSFSLRAQAELARMPLGAVTNDNQVWSLDDSDRLTLESVDVVSQEGDEVIVRFEQSPNQARRLVRYPLLSMLSGKKVIPQKLVEDSL